METMNNNKVMDNNMNNAKQDAVVLEAPKTEIASAVENPSDKMSGKKKGALIAVGALVTTTLAYFGWKAWQKRKATKQVVEVEEEIVDIVEDPKPEKKPEAKK